MIGAIIGAVVGSAVVLGVSFIDHGILRGCPLGTWECPVTYSGMAITALIGALIGALAS